METPVSLLERLCRQPDPQAWSRFVQLYLPLISFWGRSSGLQDADVADLCQEVFVLLMRKLPEFQYDGAKSFRSWLRMVTLNKWRELRRRSPAVQGQGNIEAVAEADPAERFWEEDHQRYLATWALRLMQKDFDEPTWRACWETAVEDRAGADVARELGMSLGAVYAARSRVLRRLRDELDGLL